MTNHPFARRVKTRKMKPNKKAKLEFYFAVYDKEDTYNEGECLTNFDTENEARDFVISENAGYGYEKLYYKVQNT